MGIIATMAAATSLVTAAADLFRGTGAVADAGRGIRGSSAKDIARRSYDMALRAGQTNSSIAQFTGQTAIRPRAFIDERIAAEEVLGNLLKAIRSWYLAQIMCALQLNQLVSRGRSVQDVFGVIQTGDTPHYSSATLGAMNRLAGLESFTACVAPELVIGENGLGVESAVATYLVTEVGLPIAINLLKKGITNFKVKDARNAYIRRQVDTSVKVGGTRYHMESGADSIKFLMRKAILSDSVKGAAVNAGLDLATGIVKNLASGKLDALKRDLDKAKTEAELRIVEKKYKLDEAKIDKEMAELARKTKLDEVLDEAKLRDATPGASTIDIDAVNLDVLNSIATGELFNVTLTNPEHPEKSIQVPILMQMLPLLVPSSIGAHLIDREVSPALWQRWTEMKTGEKSFWSDFIGQKDILARRSVPNDPEAARVLKTFLDTIKNKDAYSRADIASNRSTGDMSKNLPNSVMIFSDDTVQEAYLSSGLDLRNSNDRDRYFRDTYTMIIAIINPSHQRIEIAFNGIPGIVDISYSDLKPKQKNFDPTDLVASIAAIAAGRRPPV